TSNTIYGIYLVNLSSSIIYNNNFINNTSQTGLSNSANTWDNGYPSGGNRWSDYNGTDSYRGLYQNVTGSDGIGDTPYVMAGNNTDHYPLMGSFGLSTPAGLNVTVFPSDDVGLIFQNVTYAGSTTASEIVTFPVALSNLTGEYIDVVVGARFSGNVTVRLIFDGSNMTQDQKSRLQLMQFTLPGDITGSTLGVPDGKVDIRDIAYVAKQFGTTTSSPNWNPIADLTGPSGVPDGRVDIRDIAYVAKQFGTSGNSTNWTNITTYVDTTSNVIYGITTHFSIIGIHQG
ncbi:MAG TPA: GC-type dockerin domain-anchored protein, partial [Candidatus Acidoferrum sp.]|nr:GC-type dockerin domain-anchored protein [Candidatus Acidoferrum sp.]